MSIFKKWKDLHDDLYEKGVKDIGFLVYTAKEVRGIDPKDPNLTLDERRRVMKECIKNPWYFLREVVEFPIDLGTLGVLSTIINGYNVYGVLPICCKTMDAQIAYCLYNMIFTANYNYKVLAPSNDECENFILMVSDLNDKLPSYIQIAKFEFDKQLERQLGMPKNATQASCFGRGMTCNLYIVNMEHIKYIDIILQTITPILGMNKTKLFAISEIGDKGTHGKMTGDRLSSMCRKWFPEMLDITMKNKTQIIYVNMPMRYITDDKTIKEYEESLGNDWTSMVKFIYCQR